MVKRYLVPLLLTAVGTVLIIVVLTRVSQKGEQRALERIAAEHRENADAIRHHHVLEGMSTSDVRQAWGEPKHTVQLSDAQGDYKQWDYGSTSLYFRDGKVRAVRREETR
jgi:hypothetical protein